MANQKATALTGFTPILTDIIYAVDDPGGTPISGKVTFQQAMDLMEANMTVPSSVSSAYLTSTILASTSNAEGASLIGVEDSGLYWTATTVEGVLAEIGANTGALAALDEVGTAQIQADAITPTELENTTVTPGSYTLASLTVDAQGRLTAASSGTTDWSATVDANIVAGADGTIDIGSETFRFGTIHVDAIDLNGTPLDGSSALAAPAGDRIMFYDLTAGGLAWLTVGTGLSISDTTITASASAPEGTAVLSTGEVGGTKFLREDGDNSSSWQPIPAPEGSAVLSTGEAGGVKFLREDGDGTSSWQTITTLASLTSIQGHTVTLTGDFIRSGAHSLTLTTGGATNVTLPTTGTLAAYGDTTANFTGTLQNGGSNVLVASNIGSTVQGYDADTLKADTNDNLTAGFTSSVDDDGSKSTGSYAPDPATGNYKQIENAGAFTLAPPSLGNDIAVSMSVLIINHATTAGTITTSGFTHVGPGDSFTTTGGDKFLCRIDVYDDGGTEYSLLQVVALQ